MFVVPLLGLGNYVTRPEAGLSPLPLVSQLQHQLKDWDRHPQRGHERRRRLTTLTRDNTAPIRIHLDTKSLYEDTAPAYSACFRVGDWYRKGLPNVSPAGSTPTPPSVATCTRTETSGGNSDCWGICEARDVITTAERDNLIAAVTQITEELSEYFAVVPIEAGTNLKFQSSTGRYDYVLSQRGYASESTCARDCTMLSAVAVDPSYCTTGVANADVVLSLTRPPVVPGAAGTGSWCISDERNRPLWMVFSWLLPFTSLTGLTIPQIVEQQRALIWHEIIHGLGFSNTMFNYAYNTDGTLKNLIQLKAVSDTDGATDEVWHFVRGRAYETAQSFFGCSANETWLGLPLMGLPELGRASHWETRVMRDDVMTYGGGPALISSITLAAMEDLGHYLANYSAAGCMHWGYQQGCDFVVRRCGVGANDQSAVVSAAQDCGDQAWWSTIYDSYLQSKCVGGLTPCSASPGYGPGPDGTQVCNAQCKRPIEARADCSSAPAGEIASAATEEDIADKLAGILGLDTNSWQFYVFLACGVLVFLIAVILANAILCPLDAKGQRRILLITNGVIGFVALLAEAFTVYIIAAPEDWPYSYPTFEGFFERSWLVIVAIALGAICAVSLTTFWAACFKNTKLLIFIWFFYVLLVILQIVAAAALIYWYTALDYVTSDTVNAVLGGQRYDGKFASGVLTYMEGYLCSTYRTCCFDPDLLNFSPNVTNATAAYSPQATCLHAHEGSSTSVTVDVQDPSSSNFCALVTGSQRDRDVGPKVCSVIEEVVGPFTQSECQQNFCPLGVAGYEQFVSWMVDFVKDNAIKLSLALGLLMFLELMMLANAWRLRKSVLRANEGLFGGRGPAFDGRDGSELTHYQQPGMRPSQQPGKQRCSMDPSFPVVMGQPVRGSSPSQGRGASGSMASQPASYSSYA